MFFLINIFLVRRHLFKRLVVNARRSPRPSYYYPLRSHTKNCKYRPFLLAVNAKEVRHGHAESPVDGNQIKQQEMPVQKRKIRDFFIDFRLALICLVSHHHSRTLHHTMLHHSHARAHHTGTHHSHLHHCHHRHLNRG